MNPTLLAARRQDLLVQEMSGEIVVYDTANDRANVLNSTAAVIWKLADGNSTVDQIAASAARELNAPVDQTLVWHTLHQLSKKDLLETPVKMPATFKSNTRRDFIRAGVVGAAVVLPVIVTMTAPTVASAASCLATGQPCSPTNDQCCSECLVGVNICM